MKSFKTNRDAQLNCKRQVIYTAIEQNMHNVFRATL